MRLHDTLKREATTKDAPGLPAQLITSSRVVSINCEDGLVATTDGTEYRGDVIVGADGVHSIARLCIPGWGDKVPFDSGKSAFRFMIPRSVVAEDPLTSKYCERTGGLVMIIAESSRVVVYPTNNNEELNFVCIHPSEETNASGDWNNETSIEKLLRVFGNFGDSVKAMLAKANPATLKLWNLLDMEKLPTFAHGRMALVGDAAHPFLPHQGQGAGMAIEDAASLTVMLSNVQDKSKNEVSSRLQLYSQARYERAHTIQHFTRIAGQDEKDRTEPIDMNKYTIYNFGHDEWDFSTQKLREWQWSQMPALYWRQPFAFGPMPGPRQTHSTGAARDGRHSTSTTASIKFKTSRTVLQNLFPPGHKGLSFINFSTFALASIVTITLDRMEWLGGRGYTFWGLYIHGVQYTRADGSTVKGDYLPVLIEDLTDPILSGREELGLSKVFSDIEIQRPLTDGYSIATSWRGSPWAKFEIDGLEEVPVLETGGDAAGGGGVLTNGSATAPAPAPGPTPASEDAQFMYHRFLPSNGRSAPFSATSADNIGGEDSIAYIPLPLGAATNSNDSIDSPPRVVRSFKASPAKASISFPPLDWQKLPTLHHIASRLAEVPVYEIVEAKVDEAVGVGDLSSWRRV